MRRPRTVLVVVLAWSSLVASTAFGDTPPEGGPPASAEGASREPGPAAGTFSQADNLGMNLWTHNFDTGANKTVSDSTVLTEFVGLHYYFVDRWRIGMVLQFSELLQPSPPPTATRFWTFALLPQIGWHFYGPFYAAAVFTFAPRTSGAGNLDLGVQAVLGGGFPIVDNVRANLAVEVPYNFYVAKTIGVTPLAGISVGL
jgi:hypothetical protein